MCPRWHRHARPPEDDSGPLWMDSWRQLCTWNKYCASLALAIDPRQEVAQISVECRVIASEVGLRSVIAAGFYAGSSASQLLDGGELAGIRESLQEFRFGRTWDPDNLHICLAVSDSFPAGLACNVGDYKDHAGSLLRSTRPVCRKASSIDVARRRNSGCSGRAGPTGCRIKILGEECVVDQALGNLRGIVGKCRVAGVE
jgi:hypothetical protein